MWTSASARSNWLRTGAAHNWTQKDKLKTIFYYQCLATTILFNIAMQCNSVGKVKTSEMNRFSAPHYTHTCKNILSIVRGRKIYLEPKRLGDMGYAETNQSSSLIWYTIWIWSNGIPTLYFLSSLPSGSGVTLGQWLLLREGGATGGSPELWSFLNQWLCLLTGLSAM